MRIAVSGKGGSGKTTLSATLARLFAREGFSVLAVDGDPNPNLGMALGIKSDNLTKLHPLPRDIIEQQTTSGGTTQAVLTRPIETITEDHGVMAPDGVTLLLGAQVEKAGAG
jgi:CO dehydrogenase maturation factor